MAGELLKDRLLAELARRSKTANAVARRARIVLAAADGLGNREIAQQLGVGAATAHLVRMVRELARARTRL